MPPFASVYALLKKVISTSKNFVEGLSMALEE
jgi:hypothetical protein